MESLQATATAALQQLQQQGAAGYAWVSAFGSYQSNPQFSELYLHSSLRQSSTFQYQMDTSPATMSDLLVQLNQRGGQRYAHKGAVIYGTTTYSVFVRDSAKSASYTYETLTGSVNTSLTSLLAQLNAQGARGFRWLGLSASSAAPTSFVNLYVKDSGGPATFVYSAISFGSNASPANGTALSQALQQGTADESHYLGTILAGSQFAMVFERPAGSTTATEYTIDAIPANESLTTMLQAINARAGQGLFFWSDIVTADGVFHRIYVNRQVLPHPLYGLVYP